MPLRPLFMLLQVTARLHTLEHVYDNSRLVLSTEQIKRLWACLGPGPGLATPTPVVDHSTSTEAGSAMAAVAAVGGEARATPGEVSTLLSWLSNACEACEGEGGGGMFQPGVAAELFQVGGWLTMLGLESVWHLFLHTAACARVSFLALFQWYCCCCLVRCPCCCCCCFCCLVAVDGGAVAVVVVTVPGNCHCCCWWCGGLLAVVTVPAVVFVFYFLPTRSSCSWCSCSFLLFPLISCCSSLAKQHVSLCRLSFWPSRS